ncbi:cysteine proteinase inhibitor 4 [Andrographis paniculata]|uniref:cysteine proteinase inhibitor 4 n=1 Tax=Andrographis paniculata TaxID=175694 RepID=UPI0021E90B30|nr:cysteine proteinase inhibitor 4 [Andrographis paniculata]
MASNSKLFLLLFLFLLAEAEAEARGGFLVGGRRRVENVEDNQEIQELGSYCVREYNRRRQSGRQLVFNGVVAAETQVVSGIKYFLQISAAEADADAHANGSPIKSRRTFEAVAVVKPWIRSKELLHFAPLSPKSSSSSYI